MDRIELNRLIFIIRKSTRKQCTSPDHFSSIFIACLQQGSSNFSISLVSGEIQGSSRGNSFPLNVTDLEPAKVLSSFLVKRRRCTPLQAGGACEAPPHEVDTKSI